MASISQVPNLLRERGYWVTTDNNWWDHDNPGSFHPVGIMVHHTAMTRPLGLAEARRNARLSAGAICNVIIRENGEQVFVTGGYAYDSGTGFTQVLDWIKAGHTVIPDARDMTYVGTTNGNPWFYDIEVDHPGDGSPISESARNALVGLCWATCTVNGWTADPIIGHRTWTDRKVDPRWSGLSLRELRAEVGGLLDPPLPGPPPPVEPPLGAVSLLGGDVPPLAMQDWARSKGGTDLFVSLAVPARKYSLGYGVNPAVTYGIMGHETAFGRFGRVLDESFHNWGGIRLGTLPAGAREDDPATHHRFNDHLLGVLAVVQHVAGYAGLSIPYIDIVDPRFALLANKRIATIPSDDWTWASSEHDSNVARYAREMNQ